MSHRRPTALAVLGIEGGVIAKDASAGLQCGSADSNGLPVFASVVVHGGSACQGENVNGVLHVRDGAFVDSSQPVGMPFIVENALQTPVAEQLGIVVGRAAALVRDVLRRSDMRHRSAGRRSGRTCERWVRVESHDDAREGGHEEHLVNVHC